MSAIDQLRRDALQIYQAALRAVHGRHSVVAALREMSPTGWVHVVAVGKAAEAMMLGARDVLNEQLAAGLVITKHGHSGVELASDSRFTILESDHPVPGPASFDAGEALLRFIAQTPAEATFLFLLSGGASSLVEMPAEGVPRELFQRVNEWLLGSGLDIHQINTVRKRLSAIKGGRLRRFLNGRAARCLFISDVPGDDPASVGSGPLMQPASSAIEFRDRLPDWLQDLLEAQSEAPLPTAPTVPHRMVAGNRLAREAAKKEAQRLGYTVCDHEGLLTGDALAAGEQCARAVIDGASGVSLWGGETTVQLPPQPGRGGRNQSMALAAALTLADDTQCVLLAGGTDGTDGPTEDAGAIVDGGTVSRGESEALDARRCLQRADAGTFLAASGDLLQTGPTGTNVMDLVIGIKSNQRPTS